VDPYRSAHRAEHAEAPRDPGLVGEIIAQFADPLAFYRELVQNAIDAGSPAVEVALEYEESAGVLRVAVRDRGEGMTRDILENQLLVLFRSTKDRDDSKIGKFGIGFTSVLAPGPRVVVVHTARDGRRLTLHLHRDLTYQLFDSGPASQRGTSVELDLAMAAGAVEGFARSSIAALERWCRHATVPIHVSARWPGRGEPLVARIDRTLGIDGALVTAQGRSSDGKLTCVVAITSPATSYCGFFNHGLTLYETTEPLVGRVAVKLQDARLGHTLSRDDVRRDQHFERAIAFARSLVARELTAAAGVALRTAATSDRAEWWRLVTALDEARLELPVRAWWFPRLEPAPDGQADDHDAGEAAAARGRARPEDLAIAASGLPRRVFAAAASSPLTRLAAARGHVVLHCPPASHALLRDRLAGVARCSLGDAATELVAVSPVAAEATEAAMLELMREHLAAAYRAPKTIVIAKLDGAHANVLAIAGDRDAPQDRPHLVEAAAATKNPFGWRRLPLVLNARHATFRAACALDPRAGATLLARLLLLHHGLLDPSRSALLLDRTLDQIGVET
jgi:hypothetical protein